LMQSMFPLPHTTHTRARYHYLHLHTCVITLSKHIIYTSYSGCLSRNLFCLPPFYARSPPFPLSVYLTRTQAHAHRHLLMQCVQVREGSVLRVRERGCVRVFACGRGSTHVHAH
jgi:hypothetical protein